MPRSNVYYFKKKINVDHQLFLILIIKVKLRNKLHPCLIFGYDDAPIVTQTNTSPIPSPIHWHAAAAATFKIACKYVHWKRLSKKTGRWPTTSWFDLSIMNE